MEMNKLIDIINYILLLCRIIFNFELVYLIYFSGKQGLV